MSYVIQAVSGIAGIAGGLIVGLWWIGRGEKTNSTSGS